ncbi:hypothetical protein GCM10011515_00220 [Tsuneonella deserti]|uniref:HTH gntR-type domain-containing protein n=1 Tax=Tsuneonella deserti TaxID=2035528 RepID=A0ABQ1RXL7_9SPHN|nr:GntR family transcriptional regulator [Tsuneonella deserti]GGD84460.1 hypothetical protein GCM10011515_00220 [Tsuneonella deserti]
MNSGATAERVYDALKQRLMNHEFHPGDRLDPAMLADPLAASVTPVRDALHRLTGEGLVETRTSGGFHVPQLDEPALKDLYGWSGELVALALRGWPTEGSAGKPTPVEGTVAERAAAVFLAVGHRSRNGEHARAIDRLNARLHAVRMVEPHVLEAVDGELAELAEATNRSERKLLGRLSVAYHRRRDRAAAAIVRAVYRAG